MVCLRAVIVGALIVAADATAPNTTAASKVSLHKLTDGYPCNSCGYYEDLCIEIQPWPGQPWPASVEEFSGGGPDKIEELDKYEEGTCADQGYPVPEFSDQSRCSKKPCIIVAFYVKPGASPDKSSKQENKEFEMGSCTTAQIVALMSCIQSNGGVGLEDDPDCIQTAMIFACHDAQKGPNGGPCALEGMPAEEVAHRCSEVKDKCPDASLSLCPDKVNSPANASGAPSSANASSGSRHLTYRLWLICITNFIGATVGLIGSAGNWQAE